MIFNLKKIYFIFCIFFNIQNCFSHENINKRTVTWRDQQRLYEICPWYENHNTETINVLSIDGGGVRGIIPAAFLAKLEKDLAVGTLFPSIPTSEIFDLVVGTSTGAILSLGLLTSIPPGDKFRTAEDMADLYKNLSTVIFPPSGGLLYNIVDIFSRYRYNPEPLEQKLMEYFADKKLSDIVIPTVVTSVNANYNDVKLFRNYRTWDETENFLIRDVARSTSAAPTYFPMKSFNSNFNLVDGGIAANNPSMIALTEAYRLFGYRRKINLISLGTGDELINIQPREDMYIFRGRPTIDMMFAAQSDTNDHILDSLSEDIRMNINYHRFQVPIPENLSPMDLAVNVNNLYGMTERFLTHDGRSKYTQILRDLKEALIERQ